MGAYNCGATLADALACVAAQSYDNWELVLCDDGSQDGTLEVAKKFAREYPERVIIIRNEENKGLNFSLNRCLQYVHGSIIARMDGDDLCSPERFGRELEVLRNNPDISIVSTDMLLFDEKGVWGKTKAKERPEPRDLIRATPFCHAASMVRKGAYDAVNGYSVSEKLLRVEDYHLWVKMYEEGYRGINILEPLYQMRDDLNAQTRKKFRYRINEAYVRAYAVSCLHLPKYCYFYCMKPILIGLLPIKAYRSLHRRKYSYTSEHNG